MQSPPSDLDTAGLWSDHLGPLADRDALHASLVASERLLADSVPEEVLLCCVTASGQHVCPLFQIRDGRVAPLLPDLLAILPEEICSRWTLASWLVSPDTDLAGRPPVDLLHEGTEAGLARVLDAARALARSLSR